MLDCSAITPTTQHCTGAMQLAGGTLELAGISTPRPTTAVAVTGGTGAYARRTGTGYAKDRPGPGDTADLTLTLTSSPRRETKTNNHTNAKARSAATILGRLTCAVAADRIAHGIPTRGDEMAVMMGLRIVADPARVEEALNSDPERLMGIAQRARDAGCIHHRFFANEAGGEILVVDQWPDAESFMRFFESNPDIGKMMGEAGVTEQPTPVFWRELDTPDKF